jgi:hypothetical protein
MVYRAMLRQELARPDYSRKYEYLKYRRILVDWMSEVGEEMQVRKETVHTAIAYLERVLAVRTCAFTVFKMAQWQYDTHIASCML